MGYQTDFVGHLKVEPPLDEKEARLINGIAGCAVADDAVQAVVRDGAPRGWSNWSACARGCCLSYDGGDKANHMVPWLRFLMGLIDGHVLNGIVVGSRRDNGELYAICLQDNEMTVEILWPGNPEWSDYPPLAYQIEIDRFRSWTRDQERG